MAEAAKRSSKNTKLIVGGLSMDVGLYATKQDPKGVVKFETAGPNGGVLKFEERGVAAPTGETVEAQPDKGVRSDPLAEELEAAVRAPVQDGSAAVAALVDGKFARVLVEEGSGEVVEADDMRRGVRLEDGRFVDLTEQIAAIESRTKIEKIEVVATIESTTIRRDRVTGSFYVGGQKALDVAKLRVLVETLKKRREVAVVKFTTGSRQQLGVLVADSRTHVLKLLSLVFSEDVREAPTKALAVAKVEVQEAHVEMMDTVLGALREPVAVLDELRDDAVALREELRRRALAGDMDISVVEPLPAPVEEPDLMAALKASVAMARERKAGRV